MRKLLALVSTSMLVLFAFATAASANDGLVVASENCETFTVHVSLNNNVSIDRTVSVTTTILDLVIPAPLGTTGAHYDTTGNSGYLEILTLSGPMPATGSVTLTIMNGTTKEDERTDSIEPVLDCATPTPTPTATPTPSPTPSPTPEQTQLAATGTPAQSVAAATGTPAATIPNASLNANGSSPLPTVIFGMVLLASLTALAYTNLKTVKGTRPIR